MQWYILERCVQAIISVLIVATVVFMLVRLTGDPLDYVLGSNASKYDRHQATKY
jgi:ABC-type dipeptide/oligopeptide/nickel transport system permease component